MSKTINGQRPQTREWQSGTQNEPGKQSSRLRVSFARQQRLAQQRADAAKILDRLVANRLRVFRIEGGLTQRSLAERIGVAAQQIHKYESGVSRISAGRLLQIAGVLGRTVSDFFEERR